ncbi:hypothetical protein COO91_06996 [Nostoc flagelliforme CCNUN1]|uniref:Uncharacterized protein n=1 Tax=Nostoc flagelliforme CCNUN1 TaxID=2038116 RepID=A0A2K8T007_9NOSO|nr:hypothetical protein COO91_06996 [Nostoc flagelliforme CCNUN1]
MGSGKSNPYPLPSFWPKAFLARRPSKGDTIKVPTAVVPAIAKNLRLENVMRMVWLLKNNAEEKIFDFD